MSGLSHVDGKGEARMVDVSGKEATRRVATAGVRVTMSQSAFSALSENRAAKGDVLATARLAGIQGAKRCSDLIPLCHPLPLDQVVVDFQLNKDDTALDIQAAAVTTARTGVEMEAMCAASLAALTVYDMLKAIDRSLSIGPLRLLEKSGGRSGHWRRVEK